MISIIITFNKIKVINYVINQIKGLHLPSLRNA